MSDEVNPGDGYRLLEIGEVIKAGDEIYCASGWCPRKDTIGTKQTAAMVETRRKIDEPWENPGEGWRLLLPGEIAVRKTDECRNEYCEWEPVAGLSGKQIKENGKCGYNADWIVRRRLLPDAGHYILCRQQPSRDYAASLTPYVHGTLDAARAECKRLVVEHRQKFVIFRAVEAFEPSKEALPVAV